MLLLGDSYPLKEKVLTGAVFQIPFILLLPSYFERVKHPERVIKRQKKSYDSRFRRKNSLLIQLCISYDARGFISCLQDALLCCIMF